MKFKKSLLYCFCLIAVFKLHAQSNESFLLQIGSPDSSEYVTSLLVDENNDTYVATIVFHKIRRHQQLKLHKISRNGKILWSKTYPGRELDISAILKQADKALILAGSVRDSTGAWPVEGSSILMKTDQMGNLIWEKTFKFGDRGFIYEMYKTGDGYILQALGYTSQQGEEPRQHVFLCKTDFEGKKIWEKEFELKKEGDGNFLITPLKNGNFFCVLENSFSNKKHPTLLFTITPGGVLVNETEIPDTGINSVVEKENGELIFFQTEKIKEDTGGMSSVIYAKTFHTDSLSTLKKLVKGNFYGGVQVISGHYYLALSMDKAFTILKMSPDFQLTDKAVPPLPDGANANCFYLTDQEEIVVSGILKKPADPASESFAKSKYNYDIILKKGKLAEFFKD